MAGNSEFELVRERGWQRGLGNMMRNESGRWWKTRKWWSNCVLWTAIVVFMLGGVLFRNPGERPTSFEVALLYSIFAGLVPSVAVIIFMQSTVVGEKRDGTAAWVLSKPVSRSAFLLSKVFSNSLAVLATMIVPPGLAAYTLYAAATGSPWNLLGFLAALGVIFLCIFFFLSLTLMLGTFFNSRGPILGIALGVLLLQQYLVGMFPALRFILPWTLIIPFSEKMDAVVPLLLTGGHIDSWVTVIVVAIESILFVLIGLYRFDREEF